MNLKQAQILDAAFNLFYNHGFHAVGINEIIKEANVAKKTLYNHFPSKNELILATLEQHHQKIMLHINTKLTLAVPGKDAILVLFECLDSWLNDQANELPVFNGCYFNKAHAEFSAVNPVITSFCISHKQNIKAIFQDQVNDFEDDAEKNKLLTDLLILLREGVLSDTLSLTKKNNAAQAIRFIENLLRFKR